MWVSPFRYLRIDGYLLLPAAFRSLSRLSSALSAKASTLRSLCLTFVIRGTIVDGGFLMTIVIRGTAQRWIPYDLRERPSHEV